MDLSDPTLGIPANDARGMQAMQSLSRGPAPLQSLVEHVPFLVAKSMGAAVGIEPGHMESDDQFRTRLYAALPSVPPSLMIVLWRQAFAYLEELDTPFAHAALAALVAGEMYNGPVGPRWTDEAESVFQDLDSTVNVTMQPIPNATVMDEPTPGGPEDSSAPQHARHFSAFLASDEGHQVLNALFQAFDSRNAIPPTSSRGALPPRGDSSAPLTSMISRGDLPPRGVSSAPRDDPSVPRFAPSASRLVSSDPRVEPPLSFAAVPVHDSRFRADSLWLEATWQDVRGDRWQKQFPRDQFPGFEQVILTAQGTILSVVECVVPPHVPPLSSPLASAPHHGGAAAPGFSMMPHTLIASAIPSTSASVFAAQPSAPPRTTLSPSRPGFVSAAPVVGPSLPSGSSASQNGPDLLYDSARIEQRLVQQSKSRAARRAAVVDADTAKVIRECVSNPDAWHTALSVALSQIKAQEQGDPSSSPTPLNVVEVPLSVLQDRYSPPGRTQEIGYLRLSVCLQLLLNDLAQLKATHASLPAGSVAVDDVFTRNDLAIARTVGRALDIYVLLVGERRALFSRETQIPVTKYGLPAAVVTTSNVPVQHLWAQNEKTVTTRLSQQELFSTGGSVASGGFHSTGLDPLFSSGFNYPTVYSAAPPVHAYPAYYPPASAPVSGPGWNQPEQWSGHNGFSSYVSQEFELDDRPRQRARGQTIEVPAPGQGRRRAARQAQQTAGWNGFQPQPAANQNQQRRPQNAPQAPAAGQQPPAAPPARKAGEGQ